LDFKSYINQIVLGDPALAGSQMPINKVEYWQCPDFLNNNNNNGQNGQIVNKCNYPFKSNTKLFDGLPDLNACDNENWTNVDEQSKIETQKIPLDYYLESFLNGCTQITQTIPNINSQSRRFYFFVVLLNLL
jgi:hypothetical protein